MHGTLITIRGNLAEAPELHTSGTGQATVRLLVAVESRRREASGEWVDGPTSWYTVVARDRLATNLAKTALKGDQLLIHGRLEEREWTTDAGQTRSVWEITADDVGLSLRPHARGGAIQTWTTVTEEKPVETMRTVKAPVSGRTRAQGLRGIPELG
jgi:single-strand DNA-binding protein